MTKPRDIEESCSPRLYFDRIFNINAAKILPGEYFATSKNMVIATTLGSCVSACIRDTRTGIGGMNHFMLPESSQDQSSWGTSSARYGAYAMEVLINQLLKLGARRQTLEAKLFGGGAVVKHMKTINVGQRNAKFAMDYLITEGIPVVSSDLLDIHPRKVYFFPQTGKVMVKKLYTLRNDTIFSREQQYRSRLQQTKSYGDVELF